MRLRRREKDLEGEGAEQPDEPTDPVAEDEVDQPPEPVAAVAEIEPEETELDEGQDIQEESPSVKGSASGVPAPESRADLGDLSADPVAEGRADTGSPGEPRKTGPDESNDDREGIADSGAAPSSDAPPTTEAEVSGAEQVEDEVAVTAPGDVPVPVELGTGGDGATPPARRLASDPESVVSERSVKEPRSLPRVIAIANQKGGVGKTTTTVNLGAALADLEYRVLVVDLDPQGNATTGLGIDARNFEQSMYDVIMRDAPIEDCIEPTSVKNLFVAPATIDLAGVEIELVPAFSRELKLKRAIDGVIDDFDFILIDCPPSLGLITVNGLAAAGEVLVPIQCEYYALEGLSQLLRNVHLVASNLNSELEISTIVLTMYDARTRLSVDVAGEVREHFADRVCRSIIPRTVRLSEAPSFGQPITVFDPTSRGAIAYRELAKEVSNGASKRIG